MKIFLVELYEYFCTKIYKEGYEFFSLKLTSAHKKVLVNFLVELSKHQPLDTLGKDYLFDFVGFTFEYILIKRPMYNDRRIPFNQIFSTATLNKWEDRSKGYQYYVGQSLYERGIGRADVIKDERPLMSDTALTVIEENTKRQHMGDGAGILAICLESTTLHNKESEHCQKCPAAQTCLGILKQVNITAFINRGNEL